MPPSISLRRMLLDACGCSPLYLTLAATTALYAVALLRRVPHSFHWLTVAMLLFVVLGPATGSFHGPFTLRAVAARSAGSNAVVCDDPQAKRTARPAVGRLLRGGPVHRLAACDRHLLVWRIPAHLLLLAMLIIGALLRDRMARFLQATAILGILCACGFVLSGEAERWSVAPPRA